MNYHTSVEYNVMPLIVNQHLPKSLIDKIIQNSIMQLYKRLN
uniref:Transposase n=1 Tax=Schistosoma curassoni TaxID=6186 RepID=A0A183JND9_9TREM